MSDADVLAAVRRILDARRPAEETIRAIRQVLNPPADPRPLELNARRWPVLGPARWQRHDDPEMP